MKKGQQKGAEAGWYCQCREWPVKETEAMVLMSLLGARPFEVRVLCRLVGGELLGGGGLLVAGGRGAVSCWLLVTRELE